MTKFFHKFKKPCFWPIFGPFSQNFQENPALSHTTSYGFLAPCQTLEKTTDIISRKHPDRHKNRWKGRWKDEQTLFYRTPLATARGSKIKNFQLSGQNNQTKMLCRLGKERCTITHRHLNTHLQSILGALLSRTLNITAAHTILKL